MPFGGPAAGARLKAGGTKPHDLQCLGSVAKSQAAKTEHADV